MSKQIHFVRHGEVENPDGVLYGRLPGFGLSTAGTAMAALAAADLLASGRPVERLISSPLQRALESTAPVADALGLVAEIEPGLIEASSKLEGGRFAMKLSILAKPAAWPYLVNPLRPSWGEPFTQVLARTLAVFEGIRDDPREGDVVLVGHPRVVADALEDRGQAALPRPAQAPVRPLQRHELRVGRFRAQRDRLPRTRAPALRALGRRRGRLSGLPPALAPGRLAASG